MGKLRCTVQRRFWLVRHLKQWISNKVNFDCKNGIWVEEVLREIQDTWLSENEDKAYKIGTESQVTEEESPKFYELRVEYF